MPRAKRSLALAGLLAMGLMGGQPVKAQLILVDGEYRITELDEKNERIGVATPDAKPDVTQNWAYISVKTDVTVRRTNREGWYKEDHLNYYQFFEQAPKGKVVVIKGGRRWDGAISAKTVLIGFPTDAK